MHINSRTAWTKEFTVPTITLRSKSSLSESVINRARKELEKRGIYNRSIAAGKSVTNSSNCLLN